MTKDSSTTGALIDKATRFGERFGFPSLIAIILVGALSYVVYFVVQYEVLYTRGKVEAMDKNIGQMMQQHDTLLMKSEAALEIQVKQLRIGCATCWNAADDQTEIKRCSCNPE